MKGRYIEAAFQKCSVNYFCLSEFKLFQEVDLEDDGTFIWKWQKLI
jgi:hypothetical protein